jgi:outer membrane murein-binding lipoprotein Lpp
MILNASYGSDGMNTEKYNKIKLLSKIKTLEAHLDQNFMDDRKLADDLYAV